MGALHPGHISLIKEAQRSTGAVVCSIFVNPTQFNDPSDFEKYPVSPDQDIAMLEAAGTDILFMPSVGEIYSAGMTRSRAYSFGWLETVLEGKYRPGHFQGVGQVMELLLGIVRPESLFLGQKDYQQCLIIKKLIELIGIPLQVTICPTFREKDGLAMSSRNRRLDAEARSKAPTLYHTLLLVREILYSLPFSELKHQSLDQLEQSGFRMDYLEMADAATLQLWEHPVPGQPLMILAAGKLGDIRLIDNLLID